jgi:hypothetical protein
MKTTILYMYQAALYCETCGRRIRAELTVQGKAPDDPDDEDSYDSDEYPKQTCMTSETDSVSFCDSGADCADPIVLSDGKTKIGCYLEQDLTDEGIKNLQTSLSDVDLDPVLRGIYKDAADAHGADYLTDEQVKELRAKCHCQSEPKRKAYQKLADDLGVKYLPDAVSVLLRDDCTLPAFSSLGGYTIAYYTKDGETLCAECASEPDNGAECSDVYYEGPSEYCAECNKEIESSYGDPDADEPESEV